MFIQDFLSLVLTWCMLGIGVVVLRTHGTFIKLQYREAEMTGARTLRYV